ncbi:AAA family ATPase [Kitasatospora kifunensis]|uniref:Tetratricopeptide (TPR) repeat protein n=1 Tax=Kitasatospora kifunensis TaxID=58351 RepID=A0A7W7R8J4_KITKI|nr:ATP-binding protein [Kitasatospora kifunensis]MBB4927437.1 tetratricopeptide (TPR) repeat protein [Kitasatospora kifunensis]
MHEGSSLREGSTVREGSAPRPTDSPLPHHGRERTVLAALLAELTAGRPAVVTLTGRPGYGQNALARWAARHAQTLGLRVLHARATPVERTLRHGVTAQLLTPLAEVAGESVRALAADGLPSRPAGLAELLSAARQRATLLVVEDAQWIDPPSLHWLKALVRRSADAPLALLASGSGVTAAGQEWPELASSAPRAAHEFVLAALTDEQIAAAVALACHRPGDGRFTAAAREFSAGNPAILYETLHQFAQQGHEPGAPQAGVLRAIGAGVTGARALRALRALGTEELAVVRALAVCGDLLELPVVCLLAGRRSLGEARVCAELEATGIALRSGAGLRVHPMARIRVLEEMTTLERAELHARAAELAQRAGLDDQTVGALLMRSGPIGAPWALPALRRSSALALRWGNHRRAVAFLTRSLAEPLEPAQRAELSFELAAAELVAVPRAGERRLGELVRGDGGEPAQLRARALDLGLGCGVGGGLRQAAAAALRAAHGPDRAEFIALCWSAVQLGPEGAELFSPDLPALPADPGDPAQAGARAWQLAALGADRERVRTLARRALAGEPSRCRLVLPRLAACKALCLTEDYAEAEAGLSALLAELRAARLDVATPQVLAVRAELRLRRGHLAAAEQDLLAAEQLPTTAELAAPTALYLRAVRIVLALENGQREEARSLAAAPVAGQARHHLSWAHLLFARALVASVEGQHAKAAQLLRECGRLLLSCQHVNPALLPWRSLAARACRLLGQHEQARELSAEELTLARRWGAPSALGWAELTAGQLTEEERLGSARQAVSVLRHGPIGLVYARALAELAAVEPAAGEGDRQRAAAFVDGLSKLTTTRPGGPLAVRAKLLAEGLARPRRAPDGGQRAPGGVHRAPGAPPLAAAAYHQSPGTRGAGARDGRTEN